jgi:Fe-S cluster assembly iron-binding protein IscA
VKCTLSPAAESQLQAIMSEQEDKNLKFRVFVDHAHGDHAHYGLGLDYQKDSDELVVTEAGTEVLLEKGQQFLDGIEVDYDPQSDDWSVHHAAFGHHHE